MFRKYEKTFRIPVAGFMAVNKLCLTSDQLKQLLNATVTVEEKLDGANVGIIRHKSGFHLQKRNSLVSTSEHEQFGFFKAWSSQNYDKIMSLPVGTILYGELLYATHHIYYDKLIDYIVIFDVRFGGRYLKTSNKVEFCNKYGFHHVPIIDEGVHTPQTLIELMPKVSAYGDRAEGIVVKRYKEKQRAFMKGKLVWPDFVKEIDESDHWMSHSIRTNKLA